MLCECTQNSLFGWFLFVLMVNPVLKSIDLAGVVCDKLFIGTDFFGRVESDRCSGFSNQLVKIDCRRRRHLERLK